MEVPISFALLMGLMGSLTGYLIGIVISGMRAAAAERSAEVIIKNAHKEASVIRRDAKVQAKDTVLKAREDFEEQSNAKRRDLLNLEVRIGQRETNLERKVAMLDKKEEMIEQRLTDVDRRRQELQQRADELENMADERRMMLQQVASMTIDEARQTLLKELEEDLRHDAATLIRRVQEETRETCEREARKIITNAIERYSAAQVCQITTCTVPLPNDEMKGRIIGREGRNIRALEAATGVNILIDETPEVVVISGFDPIRREIARVALENLIGDGRIHPTRIEEEVERVRNDIEEAVRAAGEDAAYQLKIHGLDPDIIHALGRLKFRYSYGQNVLSHSIEMGHLMGMMASDLNLDPAIARRIGLLHDLGKALDHSIEGGHALIGADLAKKHGESAVVVNAIAAHHDDVEPESAYAILAKAADAITAARPGARSSTTDVFLRRLEKLEEIAGSFDGVEKCYAIQAGREVRVIVEPGKIHDDEAVQLARRICKRVEQNLEYPGQIKVTVVRETRCVEYAK